MSNAGEKLLKDALGLPPNERARIAAELISSLDEEIEKDVEHAWAKEIRRRAAAVRAGTIKGTDWRLVLDQIEQDVLRG